MIISLVVAAAENNAIGLNGELLWRLPKDMQFFKETTYGHHVLMGRKSYESLPPKFRPLPGRPNVVISRNKDFKAEGCKVVKSVEEGIQFAKDNGERELMVLGGGEIYKQTLPLADRVYITRVHHSFLNADTFFPEISDAEWVEESRIKNTKDEKHLYYFDFIVLNRK